MNKSSYLHAEGKERSGVQGNYVYKNAVPQDNTDILNDQPLLPTTVQERK